MADVNVLAADCSSLSRQQKVIYRHFRLNFIGVSSSLRCIRNRDLSSKYQQSGQRKHAEEEMSTREVMWFMQHHSAHQRQSEEKSHGLS